MKYLLICSLLVIGCSKSNNSGTQSTYKLTLTNAANSQAYVDSIMYNGAKINTESIIPGGSFSKSIGKGGTVGVFISGGTSGSFVEITDGGGNVYVNKSFYTSGASLSTNISTGDVIINVVKR